MTRNSKTLPFIYLLPPLFFLTIFCNTSFGANEKGLSVASPEVINLSELLSAPLRLNAKKIAFETLDNRTGQISLILGSSQPPLDDRSILSFRTTNEKSLVLTQRDTVNRMGKVLSIKKPNGNTFKFIDWSRAETRNQDGGGETFQYAGVIANTDYHQVNVNYIHDSPGSFLINPKTNSILYIHTGDDSASISRDAQRLMIMNSGLNPPFGIGVANLKAEGSFELHCRGSTDRKPEIIPSFKGWHVDPYIGFNVVLLVELTGNDDNGRYEAIPVQFSQNGRQWHVFVPEPQRFAKITDMSCWQW